MGDGERLVAGAPGLFMILSSRLFTAMRPISSVLVRTVVSMGRG